MMPTTISGGVRKVGGHSDASSTPEPAAGSRPDIEQPAALAKGLLDQLNGPGNLRPGPHHRARNLGVFGGDDVHDLERRPAVDVAGGGVSLFGETGILVHVGQ